MSSRFAGSHVFQMLIKWLHAVWHGLEAVGRGYRLIPGISPAAKQNVLPAQPLVPFSIQSLSQLVESVVLVPHA